ncbi:uncharacterized protein PGTG_22635 [Puccinia graminis f. sp. tritici CRL 75-36-700-3]|uniref:Uncharacterized protein n=1 Tax=Puccinia graminis f. sp. tritici (strain CRL 75-36-700-3 / race SCCL) TaxID=418459 RepID=H6QV27_PUCGT|nr:uncharacterized protein PGTG_22635 [Puccinia graminis f. sp. tritici CRL 75-36-700-3]EHS62640.1 hypothetical protein PGTG_22635 [Puccinia graminis f. sp. tritici CRL 75-36-700-3]
MVPERIWISYNNQLTSVLTQELEFVDDLAEATRNKFSRSLRAFDSTDITLHTDKDADTLPPHSRLAAHAEQLSRCNVPETPLVVKVKSDVAPKTPLIAKGVPAIIWLSYNNKLTSVPTQELEFVDDLAKAVKSTFSRSLRAFESTDITLHVNEHAEALTPHSRLAEHAAQLSHCSVPETPLVVRVSELKAGLNIQDLIRFWKALPEASLVVDREVEYLELKESYILGDKKLGHRLLVRPIYKELCEFFKANAYDRWVVTGTPGIGKTFFSVYYMWIAARAKKTVVWQPPFLPEHLSYLMTSSGVELVGTWGSEIDGALAKSEAVHIVDGKAPKLRKVWTLLVTSPQHNHYHQFLKDDNSKLLYMPPWSYEELQTCKAILYPDEQILPTALMDRVFEWYGGVPRYVLARASTEFKRKGGNEDAAFEEVNQSLTEAINRGGIMDVIKAYQAETPDGQYSHRVVHIFSHPSGELTRFHLSWASDQVATEMSKRYEQELRINILNLLRDCPDGSNFRGMLFEMHAQNVLQEGGTFQVRPLGEGDPRSGQNIKITFPVAERRTFKTYEEVDLRTDVFWRPCSATLASIDSLRGPANFFQITVSNTHPIKHQGLSKALELVDKSESSRRLYFVVPSNIYSTYKHQPYHTKDGKIYKRNLGDIGKVEQWALMIPIGAENLSRGDKKPPKKKQAV